MVLLPNGDEEVVGGGQLLSSASTELASEGTPAKVFIAPSSSSSSSSASASTSDTDPTSNSKTTPVVPSSSNNNNNSTPSTTMTALMIDDEGKTAGEGTVASATVSSGPLSPYRPSRVTLGSVNACITCNLCKGYLIDATTIVECLHSFCHSCIIKHLHTEQYCPQCEVMINKAKPNIKPDVPLQSIVFKLVPELYENELRRRRDFYRDHPASAALATPAQRGEDTEHLIFSPNEQISLSLEYAESELAEDNKELLRARYLLCPAVFSIAMMKKFLVNKYGISERQFCVEIMYKVKTIVLPDYYTLMDVAYIYTWKRDAPMKYFYRIRTTETNPLELPEIPLRRSPSLITTVSSSTKPGQQQQPQQPTIGSRRSRDDSEEDDKENMHLAPLRALDISSAADGQQTEASGGALAVRPTTIATPGTPDVNGNRKMTVSANGGDSQQTPTTPTPRKNESIKLKIELNKNKYVSFLQSPQADVPLSQSSPAVSGSASGRASSPASGGRVHKSDRPDKVKRKKMDSPRTQKIQEKMDELKLKIEKIKDHGLTSVTKKKKLAPYKVELSPGIAQSESKKLHSSKSSGMSSSGKTKVKSPKSHSSSSSSPTEGPKHPIVLKIDQRSPDMATSTLKFEMTPKESKQSKTPSPPPFPPSPPSPPVKRFEDEKSQFLNSFQLAPIKTATASSPESKNKEAAPTAVSPSSSPPKSPGSDSDKFKKPKALPTLNGSPNTKSSSPPREPSTGSLKRKAKDSNSLRSGPKKQKLSDDEIKAMVEKKVAENIKSPSEHIVPPIFLKPKVPPPPPSATPQPVSSPPLPAKKDTPKSHFSTSVDSFGKSPKASESGRAKCDSPRPFLFKTPPPPPPPIVSVSNIPAVKPSQQVLPAPLPQKAEVSPGKLPSSKTTTSSPTSPKVANGGGPKAAQALAQAPARRPTVPTKLPTSHGHNSSSTSSTGNATTHNVASGTAGGKFQKPLELKRAQSNPWLNITSPTASPATEISKLRPEDLKNNVKVYGPSPPPAGPPSQSVASSSVSSTPTTVNSMPKLDGGNFAVPKPKPAPKQQQPPVSSSAVSTSVATSSSSTSAKTPVSSASGGAGVKVRPVNYLNYAMFNSKAAPAGSRTPIPSYSNSPSYSPDSPGYNPNLNISTNKFKYANPTAFSNYMQNMMSDRKPGSTSPPTPLGGASPSPTSSPSPPHQQDVLPPATKKVPSSTTTPSADRKRPASAISPDTTTKSSSPVEQPPEKQPKVQSLLNKINIPSSLSITLATEEDEVARQTARKLSENDPTNNYIEIVKLPEIPISEAVTSTDRKSPPAPAAAAPKTAPISSLSPPGPPAIQVLPVTTAPTSTTTATASPSFPPVVDTFQKKFMESINANSKPTKVPKSSSPALNTSASETTPPTTAKGSSSSGKSSTTPPPPRPSTPKVPSSGGASSKYKNPNATVLENGKVKLHNYLDVDQLVKGFNASAGANPQRPPSGSSSSSSKLMPPPPVKNNNNIPIAPKSNGSPPVPANLQRKAISPPVMRSPSSSSPSPSPMILNGQPKSKTPPSILPSMASMGPMFDIQMKSNANASSNTPLRRHSTTTNPSYMTNTPTLPRRKITPANNSTMLVPLRSSPGSSPSSVSSSASSSAQSKLMPPSRMSDFITLHPQPSPMEQAQQQHHQQQQQFNQLQNLLQNPYVAALASQFNRNQSASIAAAAQNSFYPYFLQQLSQQQQLSQSMAACPVTIGGGGGGPPGMGMGSDALTITAAQRVSSNKQSSSMPLNSLTVTAIRGSPNGPSGPSSGKNGGGGIGIGPAGAAASPKPLPRGGMGGIPGKPPGGGS
ncbi:AGAP006403-PA-like protein [Anopheles sinensis]|uniref:AGAP006403-PA-like protein n=1 Tax=Anopheles sinensis TaxID=74873 RepID=A0A084VEU3_ANOSI|nr:AGAP006403-PA-like protein [Anopheles sinensis]